MVLAGCVTEPLPGTPALTVRPVRGSDVSAGAYDAAAAYDQWEVEPLADGVEDPADNRSRRIVFGTFSSGSVPDTPAASDTIASLGVLHPDCLVILGAVSQTDMARVSESLQAQGIAGDSGVQLIVPSRQVAAASRMAIRTLTDGLWLLYLRNGAERYSTAPRETASEGGELQMLREKLSELPPSSTVLCLLDSHDMVENESWKDIFGALSAASAEVTVISAGSERFTAWQGGGMRHITLGPMDGTGDDPLSVSRGRFPGILWGIYRPGSGMTYRALVRSGMLALSELSRERQDVVDRLVDSLHATPMDDRNPVTTVTLTNPTSQPLEFEAHWEFRRHSVEVQPRISGFTLIPGETFRQQFRFVEAGNQPLKSASPTFFLAARLSVDGERRIQLSTAPWCRIAGDIGTLDALPAIDGILGDTGLPSYEVGLPSQVVSSLSGWDGPKDISGQVRAAVTPDGLYLSVMVMDDQRGEGDASGDAVDVFLQLDADRRVSQANPGDHGVAHIRITPDGAYNVRLSNRPELALPRVAVAQNETGYGVELGIPVSWFPHEQIPARVRFDVGLTDADAGDEGTTTLFLSGKGGDPLPAPDLFGVFYVDDGGS